jgi:hypothetical protein
VPKIHRQRSEFSAALPPITARISPKSTCECPGSCRNGANTLLSPEDDYPSSPLRLYSRHAGNFLSVPAIFCRYRQFFVTGRDNSTTTWMGLVRPNTGLDETPAIEFRHPRQKRKLSGELGVWDDREVLAQSYPQGRRGAVENFFRLLEASQIGCHLIHSRSLLRGVSGRGGGGCAFVTRLSCTKTTAKVFSGQPKSVLIKSAQ